MRSAHPRSSLLLSLLIASSASAVTMDWTLVGDPGNDCDLQPQGCFGSVGYSYEIGIYEVTNAQYTEFLNAKAAADPLGLYNTGMGFFEAGGIARAGAPGSYTYSAISGRENTPVSYVSFYDALRFANWMNNGQGSGDTETGAYTLLGGTATPSNENVTRNAGATIAVTNENEWFKAAYYAASSTSYFDYPAGSNTVPTCAAPTAAANSANCGGAVGNFTAVGSYPNSASPYGTFDQAGNGFEWNETLYVFSPPTTYGRGLSGGNYGFDASYSWAGDRSAFRPDDESQYQGFRLVRLPEPRLEPLVIAGLLGLASLHRMRG
jgi:formylglycine-generating enzyme required for sulfatase activity